MQRNIEKFRALGRDMINHRDDLSSSEVTELYRQAQTGAGLYKAITTAFYMGYAVGRRRGEKDAHAL